MWQVIHINSKTSIARRFHLSYWQSIVLASIAAILLILAGVGLYRMGINYGYTNALEQPLIQEWQDKLVEQGIEVKETKEAAEANLSAMAKKVAMLQAHILRLDALGERLVDISKMDPSEFNFDSTPGIGGPDILAATGLVADVGLPGFMQSLDTMTARIDEHLRQFSALETLYQQSESLSETYIHGRPVAKGWVSSNYGMRSDPFHGHRAWHAGVDIAGKENTQIIAVASGVVTHSGKKGGYGKLVEIDHGNGYVTRYAHSKDLSVKKGDLVEKGQQVASMGSTGRSTGPHVHFEVLKNGKTQNPARYINRRAL